MTGSVGLRQMETPIGPLALVASDRGIVKVVTAPDVGRLQERLVDLPATFSGVGASILERAVRQLQSYFAGRLRNFDLPLELVGVRGFNLSCLRALQQVPYGEVVTYGELAAAAGSPRAARAVGHAMAINPLPLLIPCHRVIAAGCRLGGYSGGAGLDSKRLLLDLELRSVGQAELAQRLVGDDPGRG